MRFFALLIVVPSLACNVAIQAGTPDGGSGAPGATGATGSSTAGTMGSTTETTGGSAASGSSSTGMTGTSSMASTAATSTTSRSSGGSTSSSSGGLFDDGGAVSTLAGNGAASFEDGSGGPNGTAAFDNPMGVAVDDAGTVYVADTGNDRIRKIASDGTVTTLAGNGLTGWIDGPGNTAQFTSPTGLALGPDGNLYVADQSGIRKVDPSGNVSTVAGGLGNDAGQEIAATGPFEDLQAVAVDQSGNLYASDIFTLNVWKIDPSGAITVLAGNGTQGFFDGTGGDGGTAEFRTPIGVAVDGLGNVYVADAENNRVRKIDAAGNVTTLAGTGAPAFADGTGGATGTAELDSPGGVAVDALGNVYVADTYNQRVRKIDLGDNVSTLAGNGTQSFADGSGGPSGTAELDLPAAVAVDAAGDVFVADSANNRIRLIRP